MSEAALKPAPEAPTKETGIQDTKAVADALARALADTYVLMIKTHAYHWNVVGPMFYAIHNLTEDHYRNMFEAADDMAERIRALGHLAPMNYEAMIDLAKLTEASKPGSSDAMVKDLADDHERLAQRLHAVMRVAEAERDHVTLDLATQRSGFHEKAVWMLRALLAK